MEGLGGIWILLSTSHLLFNKETEFLRSWGRGESVDHSLAIVKGGLVQGWAEGAPGWLWGAEAEGSDFGAQ